MYSKYAKTSIWDHEILSINVRVGVDADVREGCHQHREIG